MRIEFQAFDARCESCGHQFLRPELGDMSYGEFIFANTKPPHYAYCNAFDVGPRLIRELLGDTAADCFRSALAQFADGSVGTDSLKCPSCGQASISRAVGGVGHSITIPSTTYSRVLALPRAELATEVATFKAGWPS